MPHPQTEGPVQGQPISPEEMALRAMVEDLMRANPGMTPEEALPIAQARMEAGQPLQANTLAQAGSRIVSPSVERPPVEARGGGGVSFGAPQYNRPQPQMAASATPILVGPSPASTPVSQSASVYLPGPFGGRSIKVPTAPAPKTQGPQLQPGIQPMLSEYEPFNFAEGGGVGLRRPLPAAQGGFVPRTLEQHGDAISAMFQPLK